MNAVSQPLGPCPCLGEQQFDSELGRAAGTDCAEIGTKLTKFGHLVGCSCASCRGRRNRRKGQAAQAKGHRALGGTGFTPGNEESVGGYPVRLQVEWKTGEQIPANLITFLGLEWTKDALKQAQNARRIGDGSMPAVGVVIGAKTWLIVEADRDMDGAA